MPPKRSTVADTTRSTSSSRHTSPATASTSAPVRRRRSSAVRSSTSARRAQMATFAPSSPSRRADALPIPLAAAGDDRDLVAESEVHVLSFSYE